jgi:hypothetical protein
MTLFIGRDELLLVRVLRRDLSLKLLDESLAL